MATTTADGRYYSFTTAAVRRSIDRLAERRIHEQFPGYLALLHYEVSRDEVERDAADINTFYQNYLRVEGAPETRPFLQPFRSRGSGVLLSNRNTSGSYSEASIRPGRALSHVFDIVPATAKRVYRLKPRHAEAVVSEMLFGQPLPAVALAAFLFRDRAVRLPSREPDHVIEVLRAWLHLDPGTDADTFETLFANDGEDYDAADLQPFDGPAAGDVTEPFRWLSLAELGLGGLDEGGGASLAPPAPENSPDAHGGALHHEDASTIEEPEGLDNPFDAGWGDYPLDAVFVRTEPRTVGYIVDRIERERYILDPEFQRDFVWSVTKQSKLIESCIMRIPLPVFYVAEAPDGRIIVVDGLQRLTSFYRFIGNHFRLTGLGSSDPNATHPLEGKLFRDLSITLQERVAETPLTMYILDSKAPERARLDIFERVNSGEPLTRQQMRNALYNGPATIWLREAAASPAFRQATGASLNVRTMRDREAINRFVAFKLLGTQDYRGDMDTFLAKGLSALAGKTEADRAELRADFDRAMALNHALFGQHAFRKSLAYPRYARSVINISLFEVCAVTMSGLGDLDEGERAYLRDSVMELMQNTGFVNSITYSTNSASQVRYRFGIMEQVVAELAGDSRE